MKRFIPLIFLGSIFFIFLIGRVGNAYDKIHPQFYFLGLINLISIAFIFFRFSFDQIFDVIKKNRIFIFYTLYIFFSLISILFALNKIESLIIASQYLTFFFSFLVITLITTLYQLNVIKLVARLTLVAIILESCGVLYSVFDYVIIDGNPYKRSNEYAAFAGNINITAFSLVIKSSLIYYLLFNKPNKMSLNLLYTLIISMVSCSLFFLLTRGALLAFLMLGILIVSFVIYNQQNHIKYKSKIIGLLVAITIGYFFSNSVMSNDNSSNLVAERVASISVNTEDESIGQRLRYYKLSTQIIGENFLTGIGIGNWKFQSIAYDAANISEYTVPYHAHNDFLQVASEVGIFGLLAYMCVFLIPILGSIKHIFTSKNKFIAVCLLGALSVYLLDSMLNFPVSRPISHIYFLFILVAYQNLSNQHENNF